MYALSQARRALEAVDLRQGLAVPEVHDRLAQGVRLRETGQRILAFYLTEMEERDLHQASGHSSTASFAEDRLGLAPRRTRELIAVGRKLLALPAIDCAFCEGRLGWFKLLQLVKVASPEHERAWLERALESTCRSLALEAKVVPAGHAPRKRGDTKGLPEVRFTVRARVGVLTHRKLELAKQKLSAERGRPVDDAECLDVLAELFLELEEDGSVPGRTRVPSSLYRIIVRPEDVVRPEDDVRSEDGGDGSGATPEGPTPAGPTPAGPTPEGPIPARLLADTELGSIPIDGIEDDGALARVRSECVRCDGEQVRADADAAQGHGASHDAPIPRTPPALRRRVLVRDAHQCRCCRSRHRLMVHHIRYRAHGGATRGWNLITLCVSCHALVHADLLVIRGTRADSVRFLDAEGMALHEPGEIVEPRALLPLTRAGEIVGMQELASGEGAHDAGVRPAPEPQPIERAFASVVGQDALLRRLDLTARGRRARGRCFPNTLFVGPPGTGKTTLARGVAACFGARLVETVGPLLRDGGALSSVLGRLSPGDMLFIDEIHAVPRAVLELLYPSLGAQAFTLLAATTEEGDLPHALRSRFGLRESLDYYATEDLAGLVEAKARKEGFSLDAAASMRLAKSARGTPREVLRLLDCVLDEGASRGQRCIDREAAEATLARMGFDGDGLDPTEQRYLALLRQSRRPVPLGRLARMLGTSASTLLGHVEPFLFHRGLVRMTPRGRTAANVRRLQPA